MNRFILAFVLIAGMANAATWERPAGGYTPTNHSVNITKYQIDSANNTAISSAKVDGDLNKAFEGLNSLEARVAPSLTGNSGKYLTNNGTTALWSAINSATIVSGTASVTANVAGTVSVTTGVTTAYFYSGGLIVSGISATAVSATSLYGTALTAPVASITSLTATTVTATTVIATTVSATNYTGINTNGFAKAWVQMSAGSSPAISSSYNISAVSRIASGEYNVSFTTPFSSSNYAVAAQCVGPDQNECEVTVKVGAQTAGGLRFMTRRTGAGGDVPGIQAVFFGAQ